jgi:EAL domain-containing protein (putative c-di-GMP-specific phosphodiesterase class I)
MDDFGTGYSSLTYLQKFEIDTVKIDTSLFRGCEEHPQNQSMVQAIIVMGHTLGMEVLAEGIETEEQLKILDAMECDSAQGYFFSPPVPVEEFERRWLS